MPARVQVFRPRQTITAPPPTEPTPQQQPGVVVLASEAVPPGYPFAGSVTARSGPAQPLTAQQIPGRRAGRGGAARPRRRAVGRVSTGVWGLQQPVFAPTRPVLARAEEPHPEPGRIARDHGTRLDHLPSARPHVAARNEDRPPEPGRAVVGTVGFGDPRRPVRPLLAARECERPHHGSAVAGKPPPPDLTPQQLPGVVRIAVAEEPPPFPGWYFARVRPLVPSDRLRGIPLVARIEESLPADGRAIVWRLPFGPTPPARFVFTLARTEEPRPAEGLVVRAGPAIESLTAQQMPGRILIACVEPPRVWDGWLWISTGRTAGAIPPTSTGYRPGSRFQRADIANRAFKRVPRMHGISLAYLTKTKTPTEALTVVFDYANWPEIVGGATVASAVITGIGGAALSGLTAGTPTVLAAATVIDQLGTTVAANKGVQVTFFGGSHGSDVIVECAATFSSGDTPRVIAGKIAVRNAV